jgi:hypothetical protein
MDIISIGRVILFICCLGDFFAALILWSKSAEKDLSVFYYGLAAFFSSIFCFTLFGTYIFDNKLFWARATWVGILILPSYLSAIYYSSTVGSIKHRFLKLSMCYFFGVILVIIAIATSYFIKDMTFTAYGYKTIDGPLKILGRVYIVICLALGIFYIPRIYSRLESSAKWRYKYFFIGVVIYAVVGILAAGLIPIIYPQSSYIVGSVPGLVSVFAVAFVTYAILKRQLFGIKLFLTQILVFVIGLILLIQAFISKDIYSKIFGFITFFFFLFAGYLLIRTTQKEIKRKEEVEKLAKELEGFNQTLEGKIKERTKELETSYQEIKAKKDELENFYNLAVGRELKMVELKKKIGELKKE